MPLSVIKPKQPFESSVSVSSPKVYATESLTANSGGVFFGALFIAIVPLAIVGIPLVSIYTRRKRSDTK